MRPGFTILSWKENTQNCKWKRNPRLNFPQVKKLLTEFCDSKVPIQMPLHENGCRYMAAHIIETIENLCFKLLGCPACSPDFPPSDIPFFGTSFKRSSIHYGQRNTETVHEWLHDQPKTFSDGISKFVSCWKK